jgi:hypothetical protein
MLKRIAFLFLGLSLTCLSALAAEGDDYFRIARLSYLDGHVSFQHSGEVDWTAASINLPLQPGDRVYTGNDGRAEIEFDDGSVYRLAEKTDIELLSLREDLIQIRVLIGLSSLTVESRVNFEVDTPAAAFNTLRKGSYRFDVVEDGNTDAIVRKGLLDAANDQFSRQIETGELLHVIPGDSNLPALSRYDQRDEWDDWNDRRNADMLAYGSRSYIPDNVYVGVSELDTYGRWVAVDSYGPAWVPFGIGPGWSPYWEGRWCYRPFWGWTWVSYEPWGWLPYHYGRWYYSGAFGWCWLPGAAFSFNFWSPGLVRFYTGPGWISWCALGPHDYYNVNHYFYSRAYAYQLNNLRLQQTRGPNDLFNRHVTGAFRTVRDDQFVSSSLGSRGRDVPMVNVEQPWNHGKMVTDRLGIRPTAMSYAPAPDRPVIRPGRETSLPAVVRSEPSVRGGAAGRTVRITNPNVSPVPSPRLERGGAGSTAQEGRGAATPGRSGQAGNPAGVESGRSQVRPGAGRVNQAAPQTSPPRGSSPGAGNEASRSRGTQNRSDNQQARPQNNNPPRRMETPPAPRMERQAPPERKQEQPARERKEPKPRPNGTDAENYSSSYAAGVTDQAAAQGPRVVPFGARADNSSSPIGRAYQAPPQPEPRIYSNPNYSRGYGYAPPAYSRSGPAAPPSLAGERNNSAPSVFRGGSAGGGFSRSGAPGGGSSRNAPARAPSGASQGGGRHRSR